MLLHHVQDWYVLTVVDAAPSYSGLVCVDCG